MPSALFKDVTDWLDRHPTIQYVSLDGGLNFKKGIENARGHITRIRDRSHLMTDLTRYPEKTVGRLEGNVCKIKAIKRHVYGRASFKLLKLKILKEENT